MWRQLVSPALVLVLVASTASKALAMGADYSKQDLELKGQLVKGQKPVHGYWLNWEDKFYYRGDTKALNQFLEAYGKFKYVTLRVVIHTGTKNASSPWDKAERDLPVDWLLYIWNTGYPVVANLPGEKEVVIAPPGKPAPTRVDIWLGKKIKLKDLHIPANVEVVPGDEKVESGIEVEKFINVEVVRGDEKVKPANEVEKFIEKRKKRKK